MKKNTQSQTQAHDILPFSTQLLERWESEETSLDDLLDSLPAHLSPRVRSGITSLLFTYFRHRSAIIKAIQVAPFKVKPRFARIIHLALCQAFYQKGIPAPAVVDMAVTYAKRRFGQIPANLINKVLRYFLTLLELPLHEVPNPLATIWQKRFNSEAYERIAQATLSPADFTFRMLNQTSIPEGVDAQEIKAEFLPEKTFYQTQKIKDLLTSDSFQNGSIYIQDPATFWAIHLALPLIQAPIESIHDVCAAPGGKSILLAEYLKPKKMLLSDRSETRQKRTEENIARCAKALSMTQFRINVLNATETIPEDSFDLVFLDVPCSNTGVMRHRPDALWRFTIEKQQELVALQSQILEKQAPTVKLGGLLIYSTCSIEPDENELQIQRFVDQNPNFKVLTQGTLLPSCQHDGAFAAVLQRI